jgi:hypothetical protein
LARLNDFKAQETFYRHIYERYYLFCKESRDDLESEFAKLSMASNGSTSRITAAKATSTAPSPISTPSPPPIKPEPSSELILIYTAMRKLREGLVASSRKDDFARDTYLWLIRAAVLTRAWEAYTPAIAHLVSHVHPASPLSKSEWQEISAYHILDLACRQGDLQGALALRRARGLEPRRDGSDSDVTSLLDEILQALIHDEWFLFWRAKRRADGHYRAIMEFAEEGVRVHALKCLARSYFTAEKEYVEKCAGRTWKDLVDEGVGWELEVVEGEDWSESTETVVIRRAKAK